MGLAVVKNMLVNFIRHRQHVPLLAKLGNKFHFGFFKNFTRGIIRRVDDDNFGFVVKSRGQFFFFKMPILLIVRGRVHFHVTGYGARENGVRAVIFIKRLKNNRFIAGVNNRHHGGHHAFGGAAANRDFGFRIQLPSPKSFLLRRNSVS